MVQRSDIQFILSENGGLGGPPSNILLTTDAIEEVWDRVRAEELVSGDLEYRLIYIINNSPLGETLDDVRIWIFQQTAAPYTSLQMAKGNAPINSEEPTIANEGSSPGTLDWTKGNSETDNIFIGTLQPGDYKSIWLRRTVDVLGFVTSAQFDNYIIMARTSKDPGTPGPNQPTGPKPPASISMDQFGVRLLQQTDSSQTASSPWFIPSGDPAGDERFDVGGSLVKNGDGSWRHSSDPVTLKIYTGPHEGINKTIINNFVNNADTYDYSELDQRGYWYDLRDFKNFELTGYFFINNAGSLASGAQGIQFMGRQLGEVSTADGCAGPSYSVELMDNGTVRWYKRMYAGASNCGGTASQEMPNEGNPISGVNVGQNTGSLRAKWFGMKLLVWNFSFDGTVPSGWVWPNPVSSGLPAAGDSSWDSWIIKWTNSNQYWYIIHKEGNTNDDFYFPDFKNYGNAVKFLKYLRDGELPIGPGVHLELWIDSGANQGWKLHHVMDDAGIWLPGLTSDDFDITNCEGGDHCGGERDQIITWGSPIAQIRYDGYPPGGVHFKWLSCRPIAAPWTTYRYIRVIGAAPPPTGGGPPPPSPPPPSPPPSSPPPPPAIPTDKFGVQKLYPTKSGGWESFINLSQTFDVEGGGENEGDNLPAIPGNSEWRVTRGSGLDWMRCRGDGNLVFRGRSARFMVADYANDQKRWKNVEFTWFANLRSFGQFENYGVSVKWWSARLRSNEHIINEQGEDVCECNGRGIVGNIHFGRDEVQISHEIAGGFGTEFGLPESNVKRTNYWQTKTGQGVMPLNKMIGYKYVVYNLPSGAIKHEIWISPDGSLTGFERVQWFEDTGTSSWTIPASEQSAWDSANATWNSAGCRDADMFSAGTYDTQPYKEGGCCYLRTNNVFEAVLSKMSCREITGVASSL